MALVVDDNADGRDIVCQVLSGLGYVAHESANGHDAVERAREILPDLIVLDLALPGLDGWQVARILKGDARTAEARILGFTAHAERAPLERAREAGCDAVLTKPCTPRELAAGVRNLDPDTFDAEATT